MARGLAVVLQRARPLPAPSWPAENLAGGVRRGWPTWLAAAENLAGGAREPGR
jgi:hypothetical protein